ncbi:S41 family peptidase [Candidatus Bipolaricaulota bacterium]
MMNRSRAGRIVMILVPTVLLLLVLYVGGAQNARNAELFSPLYQIYQYIQNYFYEPDRVSDNEALYGAMKGVVQQLEDPYSEFLDPTDRERFEESLRGEFSGVGIEMSITDGILMVITPLVGTPAEAAGALAGDKILAIDGEPTDGMTLSEAAYRIRGEIGTEVVLTMRHEDGEIVDIPIIRDTIVIAAAEGSVKDEGRIGYVRLYRFESDTTLELDQALGSFDLTSLTGFILDLRNNPGGLMNESISVASRFVDEGVVLITTERLSEGKKYYSRGNQLPNLPLAILINRGTASSSEITAGAIRDNNMGILIGETSFGKGVIQQLIEFPDGSALKLTTGEYFTPSGTVVHGVGLTPDIIVEEDEDAIDVAIEWINAHAGETMPIDLDAAYPKAEADTDSAT